MQAIAYYFEILSMQVITTKTMTATNGIRNQTQTFNQTFNPIIMKKRFLAYVVMLTVVLFTACQTEEVKPSKTQEVADQTDVANAKVAAPSIRITRATLNDDGSGFYSFTFGVSGGLGGDFCAPSGNLTVKWNMRYHNSAGTIISDKEIQKDVNKYSCIKSTKEYVKTTTGYYGGAQVIRVSFAAKIYNAQGALIGTAATGVGIYNTPQVGI